MFIGEMAGHSVLNVVCLAVPRITIGAHSGWHETHIPLTRGSFPAPCCCAQGGGRTLHHTDNASAGGALGVRSAALDGALALSAPS